MEPLIVDLQERSYPIWIGQGLLDDFSSRLQELDIPAHQKVLIITDDQVGPLYSDQLIQGLQKRGHTTFRYTVPAGEGSKSLAQYEKVMTFAIEKRLDRHSLILALGGGVVGDLAGFVASTFMRGIPFIQIPTTVLAHDSSVGGKVAINHTLGKNLIGSFYQPLAVVYDTNTLQSLPQREISSGFAEIIKLGLIWDHSFVEWLDIHHEQLLQLKEPYLSEALYRACKIKAHIVSLDEKEFGVRALLNYGHTFGHAFEALGQYGAYTHGEAVSIGMVVAARLSELVYGHTGLTHRVSSLLHAYNLPVTWLDLPWDVDQVLEKMYTDKKVVAGSLTMILLKELGQAEIVKNVSPERIKESFLKGEIEREQ